MKKLLNLFFVICVISAHSGQAGSIKNEIWNLGKIELSSGKTLEGELSYNWKAEIVQLRLTDGTVKAYSASQVNKFVYIDKVRNLIRTFHSINFSVTLKRERRSFLEEYAAGPVTIYRRLKHHHELFRMADPAQFGTDRIVYDDLDEFMYYVCQQDSLLELNRFEHDLWPRLKSEFDSQLTHYRIRMNLDLNSTLSRLLLIAHYNELKSVSLAVAAPPEFLLGSIE